MKPAEQADQKYPAGYTAEEMEQLAARVQALQKQGLSKADAWAQAKKERPPRRPPVTHTRPPAATASTATAAPASQAGAPAPAVGAAPAATATAAALAAPRPLSPAAAALGVYLYTVRLAAEPALTLAALSEETGLTEMRLSDIELGHAIDLQEIARVCKALGADAVPPLALAKLALYQTEHGWKRGS